MTTQTVPSSAYDDDFGTPVRDRIETLREQILRHGPEHFGMSSWFRYIKDPDYGASRPDLCELADFDDLDEKMNACGTTACLAGHIAVLTKKLALPVLVTDSERAAHFLGFHSQYEYQGLEDIEVDTGMFSAERWAGGPAAEWGYAIAWLDQLLHSLPKPDTKFNEIKARYEAGGRTVQGHNAYQLGYTGRFIVCELNNDGEPYFQDRPSYDYAISYANSLANSSWAPDLIVDLVTGDEWAPETVTTIVWTKKEN